jgi:hypothetical protein
MPGMYQFAPSRAADSSHDLASAVGIGALISISTEDQPPAVTDPARAAPRDANLANLAAASGKVWLDVIIGPERRCAEHVTNRPE